MSLDMVSLDDYQELQGFGGGDLASAGALDELNKAIAAGYDVAYQTGGGALRPQSLESTLKVLTFQDQHVKLWKKINKIPAYSTVEEYNRLIDYGSDSGAFFQEGGLPREEDTQYQRQTALVKFLGVTRVVTHPMTLVRAAHGDVLALEARNGTLWIMRATEQALFYGNSRYNALQFDGLQRLVYDGGNVIDAQGMPLSENIFENAAQLVASNFGMVTDCFLSLLAMANVSKTFFPRERVLLPAPEKGVVGVPITHFSSQNGQFVFNPDVFIKEGQPPLTVSQTGAPQTTGLALTVGSPTGSGSLLAAGTYSYAISGLNQNGESVTVAGSASQTPTAGQYIPLTVTLPTATPTIDQPAATAFNIYRSSNGGPLLFCKTVVPADDPSYVYGNTTFAVQDDGSRIEGTSSAFFLDMNPVQVLAFKQLAPLMKLPLATISAAIRFMVLLYGVPILYAPKKSCLVRNVGSSATPLNLAS